MERFLNLVVSGAVTGAIYSIMASGLVLTYQTSGIFNFAHGAVAFTVGYFYFQLNTGEDMHDRAVADPLGARLRAAARAAARPDPAPAARHGAGVRAHRRHDRPARRAAHLAQWLVEAVGNIVLDLGLPSASRHAGAPATHGASGPARARSTDRRLGVDAQQRPGRGVRRRRDRPRSCSGSCSAARGSGSRCAPSSTARARRPARRQPARTSAVAWILTMMLAGLGGILIAPLFQLNDIMFTLVVLGSLAAVALGGLRSIPLAFVGGLLLGILAEPRRGVLRRHPPGLPRRALRAPAAIPFVLTLVLFFVFARSRARARRGIGRRRETGARPSRRPPGLAAAAAVGDLHPRAGRVLAAVDPVAWLQADVYESSLIASGLALGIVFLSFVVVTGIGGMVSLARRRS